MLGENILKLRKKNGLSQEQLGEKINVTRHFKLGIRRNCAESRTIKVVIAIIKYKY